MNHTPVDPERVRSTFVEFFAERGHVPIAASGLVPPDPDDPVLLVTSGMHPLTPHLSSGRHPAGDRLVGAQRCVRTTDLDEVGDDSHLTLFEMLGSWSLGSYSHEQSLRWGYDLLVDGFGIPADLLGVSVFGGMDDVPEDADSVRVWHDLGVPDHRISRLSADNWWSNGAVGLCGPDSEMFVWTGSGDPTGLPGVDPGWLEVWNHVSMLYWRQADGRLRDLPRRCIDTGMGFERLVSVLDEADSVWDTAVWHPWTSELTRVWSLEGVPLRVVADHLRTVIALVGDGVRPDNSGRAYVTRRLMRRALGAIRAVRPDGSISDLPDELVESTIDWFRLRGTDVAGVRLVLADEERRYRAALRHGRLEVARLIRRGERITERDYHWLWETHGLPRDIVDEVLADASDARVGHHQ